MRYSYKKGVEKRRSRKWVVFPLVGLLGVAYVVLNMLAPSVPVSFIPADATAKKLISSRPQMDENRLYLPKINIDVTIASLDGDEADALKKGAVNRSPASGNPKEGGNYVLAAHRFYLGLTPGSTRSKSPFYHLSEYSSGDDVFVDYEGVRYAYKVTETKTIATDADDIELRTDNGRLTLYTSESSGPRGGRDVVIAEPQGTVVWENGVPKLKAL